MTPSAVRFPNFICLNLIDQFICVLFVCLVYYHAKILEQGWEAQHQLYFQSYNAEGHLFTLYSIMQFIDPWFQLHEISQSAMLMLINKSHLLIYPQSGFQPRQPCTKFCSDHCIRIEMRVKQGFHRVWIAMGEPLVKRALVPNTSDFYVMFTEHKYKCLS